MLLTPVRDSDSATMCSQQTGTLVSTYGLKVPNPSANPFVFHPSMTQAAFDFHRAQLYDYNARLHYGLRAYPGSGALAPYHPHAHDPLAHFYQSKYDPRARFVHEEPKPSHSYIGLIAMAILDSKDTKLVLADIYQWILDNYSYFRNRGPGWRNSIRHNLSLNDCFIKSGRSANGKGHYWAIHPANVDDFKKGDFRRRKAQRKVRRHMGLSVPDDEDSPSPPPATSTDSADWATKVLGRDEGAILPVTEGDPAHIAPGDGGGVIAVGGGGGRPGSANRSLDATSPCSSTVGTPLASMGTKSSPQLPLGPPISSSSSSSSGRKRLFDVESLLAPETNRHSPHGFDLSMHPAKIQKTTVVIKPKNPPQPRLTFDEIEAMKRADEEPEDENIDVEETGDCEDTGVSANHHHHHPQQNHRNHHHHQEPSTIHEISPERPGSNSSSRPSSAAGSRPLSPGSSPSPTPRSTGEDPPPTRALNLEYRSPTMSKASPQTSSSEKETIIRTPGSLALQSRAWASPMGASGVSWRDGHPSAFHSTGGAVAANTLNAWNGVAPHAYPIMSAPFALSNPGASPAEALAAQQRWQETFTRMMASRGGGGAQMDTKADVKSEA